MRELLAMSTRKGAERKGNKSRKRRYVSMDIDAGKESVVCNGPIGLRNDDNKHDNKENVNDGAEPSRKRQKLNDHSSTVLY